MAEGTFSRPPLVLVGGDQEWAARAYDSILGPEGYAVLRAYMGKQVLDLARSTQPSAILVDLKMPDLSGLDVCRMLRDEHLVPASTPIFLTTSGVLGRSERLAAFKAGAWDVLVQPTDSELLLCKLANYMAARREFEALHEASLLDGLTGLYNARGLARRAREIGAEALRRRAPLACVAFAPEAAPTETTDQDFVDQLARHLAGHIAAFFREHGRLSDAIGRLGRTEFGIVAPATEAKGAQRLVERIEELLAAHPMEYQGSIRPVRLRAGFAAVPDVAESSADAVELLLRATAALRENRAVRVSDPAILPSTGLGLLH